MKVLLYSLFLTFFMTSCLESSSHRSVGGNSVDNILGAGGDGSGNGVTNGDGGISGDSNTVVAKVELRHLIEPLSLIHI